LQSMPAPDRLLYLLKSGGPTPTSGLAAKLEITDEAARQQLLRLQQEGLVEACPENRGRGRPRQVWKLTVAANRRFPDSHGELTAQLIHIIRRTLGEPALDRLIEAREQELLDTYRAALKGAPDLKQRIDRLVSLRNAEGYMAECRTEQDGYLLIEHHCPICAASGACLKLCRSEMHLFNKLLGSKVSVSREEFMLNGSRRCVYRIRPKTTKGGAPKSRRSSS
ncbi:MAG TPA: metalloregulator ArsR/SmtB family transcription factor, partial [Clostridia bacterium]|nr:metalloregulator ArsR/SmtB family transcription factor [Clostridia bacterium]